MSTYPRVNLGDTARDNITGFEGIVICISEWLHGCRRITLQPYGLRDGKPVDSCSFDEPQLLIITRSAVSTTSDTGGPRPEPQRGR